MSAKDERRGARFGNAWHIAMAIAVAVFVTIWVRSYSVSDYFGVETVWEEGTTVCDRSTSVVGEGEDRRRLARSRRTTGPRAARPSVVRGPSAGPALEVVVPPTRRADQPRVGRFARVRVARSRPRVYGVRTLPLVRRGISLLARCERGIAPLAPAWNRGRQATPANPSGRLPAMRLRAEGDAVRVPGVRPGDRPRIDGFHRLAEDRPAIVKRPYRA